MENISSHSPNRVVSKNFLCVFAYVWAVVAAQLNAAADVQSLAVGKLEGGKCGGEQFLDHVVDVRFGPAFFGRPDSGSQRWHHLMSGQ